MMSIITGSLWKARIYSTEVFVINSYKQANYYEIKKNKKKCYGVLFNQEN